MTISDKIVLVAANGAGFGVCLWVLSTITNNLAEAIAVALVGACFLCVALVAATSK